MGQKTNPIGFRLGITKNWRSTWYAKKDMPALLKEDALLRKYLKARLENAAISDVRIERKPGTVVVTVHTGRPGVVITAVTRPESEAAVAEAMLRHTTTLGVRMLPVSRWELDRGHHTVLVDERPVAVKVGRLAGEIVNLSPEHEDVARAAAALGRPTKFVWAQAWAAAQRDLGGGDAP